MKIGLLILEQLSGKGGMEKVMYDVIQGLEKYGDTSSIYCCVPIRDKGCLDDIKSVINGNIPLFFKRSIFSDHDLLPTYITDMKSKNY